jgi:hypothetical protein
MKCVEIITLRCSSNIDTRFLDELLKQISQYHSPTDTPCLVEIKTYHHSVVESDFSIHIHWESEPGRQDKSPLGLNCYSALKPFGLLNHSIWVETNAAEVPPVDRASKSRAIVASILVEGRKNSRSNDRSGG